MSETVRDEILEMLREMNYDVPENPGPLVLGPEGLGLESLAVAELAVRIEDQWGVQFDEEDAARAAGLTVDEFVSVVTERVEHRAAPADQAG